MLILFFLGSICNTAEQRQDPCNRWSTLELSTLNAPPSNRSAGPSQSYLLRMAALADNRVIIAGGLEGNRTLDSIDIFDPERDAVYANRAHAIAPCELHGDNASR